MNLKQNMNYVQEHNKNMHNVIWTRIFLPPNHELERKTMRIIPNMKELSLWHKFSNLFISAAW